MDPRRSSLKLLAVHALLGLGLGACASIVGVQDGIPEEAGADGTVETGAEAGGDVVADGTTGMDGHTDGEAGADAGSDAADATLDTSGEASTMDASETSADVTQDVHDAGSTSDADASDAGCATRTVDSVHGLFVSSGGSMLATCGGLASPCGTVQLGLDHASAIGSTITTVYVAAGTYTESISLYAGLTLEGGWTVSGMVWTPVCTPAAAQAVTITAPAGAHVTVSDTANGTAALQTLTITSKAQGAVQPGESIYGVVATGVSTTLELNDVVVQTVAGGAGTTGGNGSVGNPGTGTCPPGTGTNGAAGDAGIGSTGGTYTSSGYASGNGAAGSAGASGGAGTAGGDGGCANCVTAGCMGGSCGIASSTPTCGGPGASGCGGGSGGPGTGGGGGGSSIPLFVWDAHVSCSATTLTASAGGNGGNGGAGADGGVGSSGQPGAGAGTCDTTVPGGLLCLGCGSGSTATPVTMDGGSPGGQGGAGGPGGGGGGGAGGWSCAYYVGGAGAVTPSNSMFSWSSTPSTGGQTGGAPGVAKQGCP